MTKRCYRLQDLTRDEEPRHMDYERVLGLTCAEREEQVRENNQERRDQAIELLDTLGIAVDGTTYAQVQERVIAAVQELQRAAVKYRSIFELAEAPGRDRGNHVVHVRGERRYLIVSEDEYDEMRAKGLSRCGVAQSVERRPVKPEVAGSSPAATAIKARRRCRKCEHEPMDGSEWCVFHRPIKRGDLVVSPQTYADLQHELSRPNESGPGLSGKYSADDLTKPERYRGPHITCDLSGDWE